MDVNPEPKDMYRCHPYHFMEICKPPVNKPIGSYQIHHLNQENSDRRTDRQNADSLPNEAFVYTSLVDIGGFNGIGGFNRIISGLTVMITF